MDYTLRDDEMIGPNMQHKKFFDSTADVDSNAIKFMVNFVLAFMLKIISL